MEYFGSIYTTQSGYKFVGRYFAGRHLLFILFWMFLSTDTRIYLSVAVNWSFSKPFMSVLEHKWLFRGWRLFIYFFLTVEIKHWYITLLHYNLLVLFVWLVFRRLVCIVYQSDSQGSSPSEHTWVKTERGMEWMVCKVELSELSCRFTLYMVSEYAYSIMLLWKV